MKKKILTLGLISTMAISMVACNNNEENNSEIRTTESVEKESTTGEDTTSKETTEVTTEVKETEKESTTIEETTIALEDLTDEYLLSLPENPAEDFKYIEIEGGVEITGRNIKSNKNKIVVVPSQIDGKDVIEISDDVFLNSNFAAVVLSKNLKSTDMGLFRQSKTRKVVLPEGLEIIGTRTFEYSSLKEVNIPNTVKVIRTEAFSVSDIEEIFIPKSVETIEAGAFSGCSSLKTVIFEGCPSKIELRSIGGSNGVNKVICLDGNIEFAKNEFRDTFGGRNDVTFIAPAGSKVEQYAKDGGFEFEELK